MDWKEALRKWAEMEEHKTRVKEAQNTIRQALCECKKPYVAFSGGKDSTCVLHLVLQQCPAVTVFHWDYGPYLMPREIERETLEIARRLGTKELVIETSPQYRSRQDTGIWYKEFFGRVTKDLLEKGHDLVFVGIRKEESVSRRLRIQAGRSLTRIKECWPIQNWSWKDVWAYLLSNNVPYHSVYDKYAPVVGWDKARFVTFFDPEFDKFGSPNLDGILMWRHRHLDPGD